MIAKIKLPPFVNTRTVRSFNHMNDFQFENLDQEWRIETVGRDAWLAPIALSQLAAWSTEVKEAGGSIHYVSKYGPGIRYAVRMGLFDLMDIDYPIELKEHEEAGRFVAIRNVRSAADQERFITDLQPLYHQAAKNVEAIQYSISELLRNVIEHSGASHGAYACAQFHKDSGYVSLGVADCGQGIRAHISKNWPVPDDEDRKSVV
jgi:hypothetical protein